MPTDMTGSQSRGSHSGLDRVVRALLAGIDLITVEARVV